MRCWATHLLRGLKVGPTTRRVCASSNDNGLQRKCSLGAVQLNLLRGLGLCALVAIAACGGDGKDGSSDGASSKGAAGEKGDAAEATDGGDGGSGAASDAGDSAAAGDDERSTDSGGDDKDGDDKDGDESDAVDGVAGMSGEEDLGEVLAPAGPDNLRLAVLSTDVDAADDTLHVDSPMMTYLRTLGHRVDRFRPEVGPAAVMDRDAILISSAADSTKIDPAWATAPVPVLIWEFYALGQLGMIGPLDGEKMHDLAGGNMIELVSDDALAAGLSGVVQISELGTGTLAVPVALPASAKVVANLAGDSMFAGMPVYFYYKTGDALEGGIEAPAPRVALPLGLNQARTLTADGKALLVAAIKWATAGRPRVAAPRPDEPAGSSPVTMGNEPATPGETAVGTDLLMDSDAGVAMPTMP